MTERRRSFAERRFNGSSVERYLTEGCPRLLHDFAEITMSFAITDSADLCTARAYSLTRKIIARSHNLANRPEGDHDARVDLDTRDELRRRAADRSISAEFRVAIREIPATRRRGGREMSDDDTREGWPASLPVGRKLQDCSRARSWLERYLTEGNPRLQHFAEITSELGKRRSR
jgi:hypothetical protein